MRKYFDALMSGSFKTAQDGRRLFCPWGVFGTCYILPSEHDYERLRRQVRRFTIVSLILIMATAAFHYPVTVVACATLIAFYLAWTRFLLRDLQPSTERLSLVESSTAQALAHSTAFLWLMWISSVLFVASGIMILMLEPAEWQLGIASIGMFGFCAAMATCMLVVRSRYLHQGPDSSSSSRLPS